MLDNRRIYQKNLQLCTVKYFCNSMKILLELAKNVVN